MSCCREIQVVETYWTNDLLGPGDETGDNYGLGGIVACNRIAGYVDDRMVFVGGVQNATNVIVGSDVYLQCDSSETTVWANKETFAFEYMLIQLRTALVLASAGSPLIAPDGTNLADPEDSYTTFYKLFRFDDDEAAWVIESEKSNDVNSCDAIRPLGLAYIAPTGRQWYPDDDEATMPITYEQASNPDTRITINFDGVPDPNDVVPTDPWTQEIEYRFSERHVGILSASELFLLPITGVPVEVFIFTSPNDAGYEPSQVEVAFSLCRGDNDNPLLLRVMTYVGDASIGSTTITRSSSARWVMGDWMPALSELEVSDIPGGVTHGEIGYLFASSNSSSQLVPDHVGADGFGNFENNTITITDFEVS